MTKPLNKKIIADMFLSEAKAIEALSYNDDLLNSIHKAAKLIAKNKDPLIIAGIGKSGHIAKKIASTLCSLGRRTTFLHASEASHGDLGIISNNSILVILSNSGETSELSDLLFYADENNHTIIGLTANADSTLGKLSTITLCYGNQKEICRNGLAPTTSTTVALAIGDALAVSVSNVLKIKPEDFKKYHPGGKLGNRLAKVRDVMKTGDDLPYAKYTDSMSQAVVKMSEKNLGALLAVEEDGTVTGIITDGDMRRHADNLFNKTVEDLATRSPMSISPELSLEQALDVMAQRSITSCVVVDDTTQEFIGFVHIHNCVGV